MDYTILIALIREVGSDIEAKIDARMDGLEARLEQIERANLSEQPEEKLGAIIDGFYASLNTLGHAIGEVHTRVSSDDPLPEKVLASPVMEQFVRNYPEQAPHPFNTEKRDSLFLGLKRQSDGDLTAMQSDIRSRLDNEELTARVEYNLKDAQRGIARELVERQRNRGSRDHGVER